MARLWQRGQKFLRLVSKRRTRLPREVQLEVTNRCNLDCDMCPRLSLLQVPEVDMAAETFAAVLDRLDRPRLITLTGWGEPLMHPQIFEFIDRIRSVHPGCEVALTTNGFLLNDARIAAIAERRLARVNFSLEELPWEDGASQSSDPKKGHGNSLARAGHPSDGRVVDHIRALVRALKMPRPELRLQAVFFPDGLDVLLRLVDFAADEGLDTVNLVRLNVRGMPGLARPSWQEERAMLAAAKRRARERGIAAVSINDHGPLLRLAAHDDRFCIRLDDYIYVDVEGRVAPCGLLRGQVVGDLKSESLQEIWSKPELTKFYGPSLPPECAGCDAYTRGYADEARAAASVEV